MRNSTTITEATILEEVLAPVFAGLDRGVARNFLALKFDRSTLRKIRQLLQKNNRGTISAAERIALEKYLRVGSFLDLLHAKARLALQNADASP